MNIFTKRDARGTDLRASRSIELDCAADVGGGLILVGD